MNALNLGKEANDPDVDQVSMNAFKICRKLNMNIRRKLINIWLTL